MKGGILAEGTLERGSTRRGDQCHVFRFGARPREFTEVASLRGFKPRRRRETDSPHPRKWRGARSDEGLNSHLGDNPIPSDLGLGRMKPGESPVEVRRGSDVQFVPLTWA